MSSIKKYFASIVLCLFNIETLYADLGGRGRLDSDGSSDFLRFIVVVIVGIPLFCIFIFFFFSLSKEKNFRDKEANKFGCMCVIGLILAVALLVGMCSR